MKRYILFFLIISFGNIAGQCNYEKLLNEGRVYFSEGKLINALNKFNAARTCDPSNSAEINDEIKQVFNAINQQRETAEASATAAEENRINAKENEKIAEDAREKAEVALRSADSLRKIAIKLRYQAEAINYAFLSQRENELDLKRYRALQAYFLNKKYNDNNWNSAVLSALLKSEPEYHSHVIKDLQSNLIDMVRSNNLLYFIAEDSSGIYNLKTTNIDSKHSWPNFHYLRNSLGVQHNTSKFNFKDQKYGEYKFDPSTQKISKTPSDSIIRHQLRNGEIEILGNQIRFNNSNLKSDPIFLPGNPSQTITASNVSPNENYLGIGTQEGRLYIYDLNNLTSLVKLNDLQFHYPGSLISDVVFDPEEELIATTGYDGMLKIIKLNEIKNQQPIEIIHDEWLKSIIFLDQNHLVVGTQSGLLKEYIIDPLILVQNICNRLDKDKVMGNDNEITSFINEICKD